MNEITALKIGVFGRCGNKLRDIDALESEGFASACSGANSPFPIKTLIREDK